MKNFKFIPLLLAIFIIQSQELDQAYLDSLPQDIKEDLLSRSETNAKETEVNYRSTSSSLKKEKELVDLKLRLEADLKRLDERLELQNTDPDKLKLFGSDFFTTFQTSFMPTSEANPDSSYTLDTGDVLNIQLIGQQDFIETLVLQRDGSINMPYIGKVVLAGLSLNDASLLIKSKVDSVLIGTDVYVNLDKIRDVSILVSGNAENPGIYTLSGNSNVLHALTMAGGVTEFGSYRVINHIRDNKIIETLDVYDLLIDGNYNLKKRLRSGDVIFVESRKKIVTIDGAVKRPAMYELSDNENLDRVIKYSTGIKQTADMQNIFLERMLDGTLKSIPVFNIAQFESIKPIDGDLIYVREFAYRTAKISGAVYKPGSYTMASGETVDDLIAKAGGFTETAYPFGAIYENQEAKKINKRANELLYAEFLDNIIALSQQNISGDFDMAPIIGLTKEIKSAKPSGRVVVDLISESEEYSLNIKEGDHLIIPEKTNTIFVYGEVSSEGAVMYEGDKGVEYFIKKSGGLKKYADNSSIYILHPNGETERFLKKRNIFQSQPDQIVKIYPGSIIFVPKKLDDSASRRLASQAYVSILGNLGIALASLSSIDNN
jgi:protein involved in polysaccharide export with SLBB domain